MTQEHEEVAEGPPPWLTMSVWPEPTADERDALIAAVSAYLAARPAETVEEGPEPPSRWREAARKTSVRGIAKGPAMGWGRGRTGWSS